MSPRLWAWLVAHPDVLQAFVETSVAWEVA